MVQPHRLNGRVAELNLAFLNVIEIAMRLHLAHIHGKVGRSHLLFHHPLQRPGSAGTMEVKTILRAVIKRSEEGDPLDVVPMKMRNEDVSRDGMRAELAPQLLAQGAKPGATVEDEKF